MFGWFKKKREKLDPESLWTVECNDTSIRATDPDGVSTEVLKTDLGGVIIETNDTGPWGADVWWLLFGAGETVAVAFPQGASGGEALIAYLISLEGFDHRAMVNAMASTDNNVFPVWRRKH